MELLYMVKAIEYTHSWWYPWPYC